MDFFWVMKCFIDPVVQEATNTPYLIIVVMMPNGWLRQKRKKSQLIFLFITTIQSFCAHCFTGWQCSFKREWTSQGSRGTVLRSPPPPGPPCQRVELLAEHSAVRPRLEVQMRFLRVREHGWEEAFRPC